MEREGSGGNDVSRRTIIRASAAAGVLGTLSSGVSAQQRRYELRGRVTNWLGVAPEEIEGVTNPTLEIVPGEEYEVVWENEDGVTHNFAILDDDGDVVLSTDFVRSSGETQTVEFTAQEEFAEYLCQPHPNTMRGAFELVEEVDEPEETHLRQLDQVGQATTQFRSPETDDDRTIIFDEDGNEAFQRADLVVGGMGEHFTNVGFEWELDVREPDLLSYGFTPDDELVLGAVEWSGPGEGFPEEGEPPADVFAGDLPEGADIRSEYEAWGVDTLTYPPEELEDEEGHIPDENIPDESPWVLHVWIHSANFGGVFKQLNCRDEFHRCPGFYDPECIDTTIVRPQFDIGHEERVDASEPDCQRDLEARLDG
ncbi:cupredoxin domain-containing protein [Natrialbaceae archaeon A-gly3]